MRLNLVVYNLARKVDFRLEVRGPGGLAFVGASYALLMLGLSGLVEAFGVQLVRRCGSIAPALNSCRPLGRLHEVVQGESRGPGIVPGRCGNQRR